MREYFDWARGQLDPSRTPSVYDWNNMNMAELANRALAICELSKDGSTDGIVNGFFCLEKMAQAIKERYQYPSKRRRRGRW